MRGDAVVMRFGKLFGAALLPMVFLIGACGPGGADAEPEAVAEVEATEEELHLEPDQIAAWGIEFGPVGSTTVTAEFALPGALTVNENRTARIAPLVSGQISELHVDLGSRVSAGGILVELNSPEFTAAQTELVQAFAQAELSRKDFERAQVLRDQQAIEEREFLRRQAVYEQHLAERRAAEVFLHSLGVDEERMRELEAAVDVTVPAEDHRAVDHPLAIRSPLAGIVMERDAILGDHVEPNHTIFTVSDLSTLWARLDAYEHQIPFLDPSAEVVVQTPLLPGESFPGRITFIADQVDEELRTVRVRAEIPNPDGLLKPNMFVQGFLRLRSGGEERLVVPEDAVQLLEGSHHVFVLLPEVPGETHWVIQAREVEVGEALSIGRIIESGLDGTEEIAIVGAFTLKAELTKGAGGHAHVH